MSDQNKEGKNLNESKEWKANRKIKGIDSLDGDSDQWNASGENIWEADLNISIDDLHNEITDNGSVHNRVSISSIPESVHKEEEEEISTKLIEKNEELKNNEQEYCTDLGEKEVRERIFEKQESVEVEYSQENSGIQNEKSSEQVLTNCTLDRTEEEREKEKQKKEENITCDYSEHIDQEEKKNEKNENGDKIFTNIRKTFEKYSMQYLIPENVIGTLEDKKKEKESEPNDKKRQGEIEEEEITCKKDLVNQIKILENRLVEKETLINNLRENINTIASVQNESSLVKPYLEKINFLQKQQENIKAEHDQIIDKWNYLKNLCKMDDDTSTIRHIQHALNMQELYNQNNNEEDKKCQFINIEDQIEEQKKHYKHIIEELENANQEKEEELNKKNEQLNILSCDTEQSKKELEIYKEQVESLKKENEQMNEQTNKFNTCLQKEQQEKEELKELLKNLERKLEDLENQHSEQNNINQQLKQEVEDFMKKKEMFNRELERIKSEHEKEKEEYKKKYEDQYVQLEETNKKFQLENEQIKKEKERLQILIKENENRNDKIEEQLKEKYEEKYEEMKKKIEKEQEEKEEYLNRYEETLKEIEEYQKKYEDIQNAKEEYLKKYEVMHREMEEFKNQQKYSHQNDNYEEQYENLKNDYEELKTSMEEYKNKYEEIQNENKQNMDKYEEVIEKVQQLEKQNEELIHSNQTLEEETNGKTLQIGDLQRQLENCELQLEKSQCNYKRNEEKWKQLLESEKKKEEYYINQIEHIKFEMKKLETEAYQRNKEREDMMKTTRELREINYDLKACKEDNERTIQELKMNLQQSEKDNFMKFGTFQEEQNRKIEHIMMENKKNCNVIDLLKSEKLKLEEENNLLKKDVNNFEEELKKIETYSYDIYEIKKSLQKEIHKNKSLIEQIESEKNQKEDLKNQIKCFLMQNEKYNVTIKVYKMKCNFLTKLVKNYDEQVNILQNKLQIYLQREHKKYTYTTNGLSLKKENEEEIETVEKILLNNQPEHVVKETILLREQVEQEIGKKNEILQKLQKLLSTLKEKNLLINEKNYKIKKYKILNETLQKNIENYQNNIKTLNENINDLQKQLELRQLQNLVIPPKVNIHLSKYSSLENNIKNEIKGLIGNSSNFLENTFKYINENTLKKNLPTKTLFQTEEKKPSIISPLSVNASNCSNMRNSIQGNEYMGDVSIQERYLHESKDSLKDSKMQVYVENDDYVKNKDHRHHHQSYTNEKSGIEKNKENINYNNKMCSNEFTNKQHTSCVSSEVENATDILETGPNKIAQLFNFKMDSSSSNQKNENKIMDLFSFKKDPFNILKTDKQENVFASMFHFDKSDKGSSERVTNEKNSFYNFAYDAIGMKSQENKLPKEEEEKIDISNNLKENVKWNENSNTYEHTDKMDHTQANNKSNLFIESDMEQDEIFLESEFRINDDELEIQENEKNKNEINKNEINNNMINDDTIEDHFNLNDEDVLMHKDFDIDDEEINEQFLKDFTFEMKNNSKDPLKENAQVNMVANNVQKEPQILTEKNKEEKEKKEQTVPSCEDVDLQVTDMWNDEIDLDNIDENF